MINSYSAIDAYGGIDGLVDGEDEWAAIGNAYYSIQACLNHSCVPNAHACKRPEDTNGNGKEDCWNVKQFSPCTHLIN